MGNTFQAVLSRQSNPVNTDTEGAKSVHILIRDVRTKRVIKDFKQRLRNGLVRWPEVPFSRHASMPQV